MICSHLVNLSLLLGALISWGIMWPLIRGLKGEWFPATLSESSMKSVNGYKVELAIQDHFLIKFLTDFIIGIFISSTQTKSLMDMFVAAGFYFHCPDTRRWAVQFSQDTVLYRLQYPHQTEQEGPHKR